MRFEVPHEHEVYGVWNARPPPPMGHRVCKAAFPSNALSQVGSEMQQIQVVSQMAVPICITRLGS
jgi:hypothetical protein